MIFLLCLSSVHALTMTRYDSDFKIAGGVISYKVSGRLGAERLSLAGDEVVSEFDNLPFGQQLKKNDVKFGFNGKELDNTDNYYFNARYYDYDSGKFLGVDPVSDNHAYAFVSNNPVNYVDPSGKVEQRVGSTTETFAMAIASSAILTGLNSYFEGNGFWNGFSAGVLGGAIEAGSKEFFLHNNDKYYSTKLMHSVGTSIKGNAVKGDNWFSSYRTFLGPAYVELGVEGFRVIPSPATMIHATWSSAFGGKFSVKDSLKTGSLVFRGKGMGEGIGNSISWPSEYSGEYETSVLRHEFIHTLQFMERSCFFTQSMYPKWPELIEDVPEWDSPWIKATYLSVAEGMTFFIEYGVLSGDYDTTNRFEAEARRFE